jgi:murein DD-endopeptidase MepM/ murein hydrolase activator NlpD
MGSFRTTVGLLILAMATTVGALISVPAPTAAAAGAPDGGGAGGDAAADFETIAALDELTGDHARLFRLYWASFNRSPDPAGALYWIGQQDNCLGLDAIADLFATSQEFDRRYGPLDDEGFVRRIYHNVLGRSAEAAGLAYWSDLLERGRLSRGGVVLNVSLSPEFTRRHRYPSDDVPARSCQRPDGQPTGRSVHVIDDPGVTPLATVVGLTIMAPSSIIERAGFHQSGHPGALPMAAAEPGAVRTGVMDSRNRGTDRRGAVDVVVEPTAAITAPVSGTVARGGGYTLYCRYRDGYVVINPDGRPDLEVKVLHIQQVAVRAGQRVEAGDVIAATATTFPFRSQIDALTGEPSWPHVHIEIVDPSIPRRPSSGGC